MPNIYNDCSCNLIPGEICTPIVQCRSCRSIMDSSLNTQKIIQKQVRVAESLYMMNLATLTVAGNYNGNPNLKFNASDRNLAHIQLNPVPSSGNSVRGSITRLRPGALKPGGTGVDIKHNSYDRYLAKLKAGKLKTENISTAAQIPIMGNKTRKFGMIATCTCK